MGIVSVSDASRGDSRSAHLRTLRRRRFRKSARSSGGLGEARTAPIMSPIPPLAASQTATAPRATI
jgi:hypothetical protein